MGEELGGAELACHAACASMGCRESSGDALVAVGEDGAGGRGRAVGEGKIMGLELRTSRAISVEEATTVSVEPSRRCMSGPWRAASLASACRMVRRELASQQAEAAKHRPPARTRREVKRGLRRLCSQTTELSTRMTRQVASNATGIGSVDALCGELRWPKWKWNYGSLPLVMFILLLRVMCSHSLIIEFAFEKCANTYLNTKLF